MAKRIIQHGFLVTAILEDNTTNENIDISSYVTAVFCRKRFLTDSFPLFVINLETTIAIRDRIRDNNCQINLTISCYSINTTSDGTGLDSTDFTPEEIVYTGRIRIYDKPFTTTAVTDDVDNSESDITAKEAIPFISYRVAGVPDSLLSANEDIVGEIYKDATLTDAIVNILSKSDIYDIKIQEVDNKELYKNIIVPPLSMVPALNFLDGTYKVYNGGLNLFMDETNNPTIYCYAPISSSMKTTNMLECSVLSPSVTNSVQENAIPSIDDDGNIYISYRNLPPFNHSKEIVDHSIGTENVFYSYDEYYNLNIRSQSLDSNYRKVRYIWNPEKIKNVETDFMDIQKHSASMQLIFSNMNPSLINPLTLLRVISPDYPDADGDYFISEASYAISSSDYRHFNGNISIICLKK